MAKKHNGKLPEFASLDQLVTYFENHDLGDHLDAMSEVKFEVDIQEHQHLFTLDDDLAEQLTQIAVIEKKPSEQLINTWVREKIAHLQIA